MFLNKLPAVKTPKPVVFGAAIVFGAFYFWFTQAATGTTKPTSEPRSPEI
ncbi:hypothetical protein LLE49_21180 [Alicyclobacillus tolerans]|nr:hypothetical protein [Alicyclobacillus tolerans]MCF8567238.1 hypothetical protein [Alicyclobacillus tolerans]